MIDCKELVGGSKCGRDHSKLVCNSGVDYCMAAHSSSQVDFDDINVDEPTLQYLQDIIVNKFSLSANILKVYSF